METVLSKALREFMNGPHKQLLVNLGGHDGGLWEKEFKKFLRKEPCWQSDQVAPAPTVEPQRAWRKSGGAVYFSVTSNGMTGPEWISHFKEKGVCLGKHAEHLLNSEWFVPTNGVSYAVTILKSAFFKDYNRITKKIHVEAGRRDLIAPHGEVACLIRDAFSDKELEAMGLNWFIAMHEPVEDPQGELGMLGGRQSFGPQLCMYYDRNGLGEWDYGGGFAFVAACTDPTDDVPFDPGI